MGSKRIVTAFFLILAATVSTLAQPDLSGISICIDPGHGPGNANRGPTGLYEHQVNLDVALYLRAYLRQANPDTILLTRIDTDPSLSQREDIANQAGVDWFHSIHHNAYNGQQRFTLVLYEELHTATQSLGPQWPGQADVMSEIMARTLNWALRTSGWFVRGDWSFYGGPNGGWNLGVLNDLTMPGELSEATFHDNPVEEAKLKNPGFRRFEARALYHSFLEYYQAGQIPTGALAGILYDQETSVPLNNAQVTIRELGVVRYTDDNNNGFYSLDGLAPGEYTLIASGPGYSSDTAVVRVPVDSFVFRDFYLTNNVPPTVVATTPSDGATNVRATSDIRIKFSKAMDRESVERAFHIAPPVDVRFYWLNQGRVLRVSHPAPFAFEAQYTVLIDSTARDEKGRLIDGNGDGVGGDNYIFRFTTAPRELSQPVVTRTIPAEGDTLTTPFGVITACINKRIDTLTVTPTAFYLVDPFQATVPVQIVTEDFGDSSAITLVPNQGLEPGYRYTARLRTSLRDLDGFSLASNYSWSFTVADEALNLQILDEFEYLSPNWKDPEWSGSTTGTDPDLTWFEVSQEHVLFGEWSAKLNYAFSDTGGFIRVFFDDIHDPLATPGKFGVNDILQVYIFGDASGNQFRFCLDDNESGYEVSDWITIDWYGWKLVTFDLAHDPVHGWVTGDSVVDGPELDLDSFQLRATGRRTGAIYLDRLSVAKRGAVGLAAANPALVPDEFSLSAAYPNPFNPSTQVVLEIPEKGEVQVFITDVLGRVVRTLLSGLKARGKYPLTWDGTDRTGDPVPSGVYVIVAQWEGKRAFRKVTLVR